DGDAPPIVFPGDVQGRHARETGEKGCVIATVGTDHRISTAFHRLDVVRWERVRVDLGDVTRADDLYLRAQDRMDGPLKAEEGTERWPAARALLPGATTPDDTHRAAPERHVAEVRGMARGRGEDRLWVEKVEVQTIPSQPFAIDEGPLRELDD